MRYDNNQRLREYLDRGAVGAYREHMRHPRFEIDSAAFATVLDDVRAQHPNLTGDEAEARAVFRLLTMGAPPPVVVALPSPWYRALTWVRRAAPRAWPWVKVLWALAVLALCAIAAHAEPRPDELRAIRNAMAGWTALPQQTGGLLIQFQNGGSVLATRPAGLVAINCSTGTSCSFSGYTFTLTATGGGGGSSGFDAITSGTNTTATMHVSSGATLDFSGTGVLNANRIRGQAWSASSPSEGHIPIWNSTNSDWEPGDPIVSGPDATGIAPTKNPVQTGALDNSTACSSGPCVRSFVVANGAPAGGEYGVIVRNVPSGTQTVGGSVTATQSGTWTVQPGNTANTTAWKVDGSAVTQPISAASLPLPTLAATSTKQSDGSQKAQVVDGSGNVISATSNALDVNLKTSSITLPVSLASAPTTAVTNAGLTNLDVALSTRTKPADQQHVLLDANSGVDIGKLTANQSVNVAQIAGVAPTLGDVNNVAAIAGVQNVGPVARYNATQPTLTDTRYNMFQQSSRGALLVQPGTETFHVTVDSAPSTTVTATNLSTNLAQLAGTTTDTNSGNKSAGTLRVVIATDQPQLTNKLLVTPDANSAVNIAQINGVTPLMGAGNTGTGSPRVTIASDQAAIPVSESGTWTVQPGNTANTTAWLVKQTDGTTSVVTDPCQGSAKLFININQTGNTQLITGTSAKRIYICSIQIGPLTAATSVALVAGTGSVCATNVVAVPGVTGGTGTAATGSVIAANGGFVSGNGGFSIGQTTVNADNVCLYNSGSAQVSGGLSYVVQ